MSSDAVVIRLPRMAYAIVAFLFVGSIPVAFGGGHSQSLEDTARGTAVGGFSVSWLTFVMVLPLLALLFIVRTATIVSDDGLRVRAMFGSRKLPWESITGLSVSGPAIYAVQRDGMVRLPCVRIAHLGPISRLSKGRIDLIPDVRPKPAPQRSRRR